MVKCGALHDLVPFVQFKKVKFLVKLQASSRFLNCTNGTKSRNALQISCKIGLVIAFVTLKSSIMANDKIFLW